ncbi:hypothetical protein [Pseudidiomarina terrestris]|uniref:hypothetical protein n=1 Tax=Pseudidiomarina terrestris TaxID=2820060 RepID=UPI0026519E4F|nr:hypothetical protein [Pseudidiomarina sp. 1ASP75-5]MDN7135824.1 hypothetical protein [Pseudidiomarina sp. 1ASP75-5]
MSRKRGRVLWSWIPNTSVGNIALDEPLESVKSKQELLAGDEDSITGWASYFIPEQDIYIDVEDGKVVSITSYKKFYYKGKNCIGLNILELGELLGVLPDEIGIPLEFEDGEIKTPREYSELGLQLWTTNNHVISITCLTYKDN